MKSQADCYRALLEGKTLVNDVNLKVRLTDCGTALIDAEDLTRRVPFVTFSDYGDWKIKEEPRKLYAYRESYLDTVMFFSTRNDLHEKYIRHPEYDLVFDDSDRRSSEYPCK